MRTGIAVVVVALAATGTLLVTGPRTETPVALAPFGDAGPPASAGIGPPLAGAPLAPIRPAPPPLEEGAEDDEDDYEEPVDEAAWLSVWADHLDRTELVVQLLGVGREHALLAGTDEAQIELILRRYTLVEGFVIGRIEAAQAELQVLGGTPQDHRVALVKRGAPTRSERPYSMGRRRVREVCERAFYAIDTSGCEPWGNRDVPVLVSGRCEGLIEGGLETKIVGQARIVATNVEFINLHDRTNLAIRGQLDLLGGLRSLEMGVHFPDGSYQPAAPIGLWHLRPERETVAERADAVEHVTGEIQVSIPWPEGVQPPGSRAVLVAIDVRGRTFTAEYLVP